MNDPLRQAIHLLQEEDARLHGDSLPELASGDGAEGHVDGPRAAADPLAATLLSRHFSRIIELLGEDVSREGLARTPDRVAGAYEFLTQGYRQDPREVLSQALFKEDYEEMVLVKSIPVFSLCEHHLLPFYGEAHVAYIPNGEVVGLSKIARLVDLFARRFQVQERLTRQIRDAIQEVLRPRGVAVMIEATHLCMVMRGVQKQNATTVTTAMSGTFSEDPRERRAFMHLVQGRS